VRHDGVHRLVMRAQLHVQQAALLEAVVGDVVMHFGLIPASRARQADRLRRYIAREVPEGAPLIVAGDFNDWGTRVRRILELDGLETQEGPRTYTYPARWPIVQLDHVYARSLTPTALTVPRGRIWRRMSDHLPLIADFRMTR
jgi:endonuclease/exonuclease/phosphatase family metal-dependent hydrolase